MFFNQYSFIKYQNFKLVIRNHSDKCCASAQKLFESPSDLIYQFIKFEKSEYGFFEEGSAGYFQMF